MPCYLIVIEIWNAVFSKRCKIEGKLVLITNRKSCISFRLVPIKIGDLEWPWTAKRPIFCVIFTEFCSFRAQYVKVVYKAITTDNLRLLCLVVNVCRGTAGRPRYKFLADSSIQDLMRSTCLAIVLVRSRIWAIDWYQNRLPWMTLTGKMALILRYFTEFGSGPYFALFHRIRVRCRRKIIVRRTSVSKSTFDSFWSY